MQFKSTIRIPAPLPAPRVQGLTAYQPSRFHKHVDLRLDGNEGSHPPAQLLDGLRQMGSDLMRRYPDATALESGIAENLGVDPERVLVTAGGDDGLDRVCRSYLAPGRQIILPEPTFEMIGRYARLAQGEVVSLPWFGGAYPIDEVIDKIGPTTAVITVVSPNSPTGSVARAEDLERLALMAPNALLLVDQAYAEFADLDLTPVALDLPNAVVIRSLSKAWGLAGIRVGYAVARAEIITSMRAVGQPYAASRPSLALAEARLNGSSEEVTSFVERVRQERQELADLLSDLGVEVLPSQANFVLAGFKNAGFVRDALAALGIAVRMFPSHPDLQGWLRISCPGNQASFERLQAALKTILAPEAVLLDLDGVLADVSKSYRQAVLATAESYGVRLEPKEVSAAKTEPSSNNDWVLTHRLLQRHGMQVPLEEVTRRFEELYQGTPDRPGLRTRERLAVDRSVLQGLCKKLPLAVVTGRPRLDVTRFLDQQAIAKYPNVLVCMEDAAPKPDPAPVDLALSSLGVRHAWMVGDTPDDMLAARGAGVLPLGIVAPGEQIQTSRQALLRAGAALILDELCYMEELLP